MCFRACGLECGSLEQAEQLAAALRPPARCERVGQPGRLPGHDAAAQVIGVAKTLRGQKPCVGAGASAAMAMEHRGLVAASLRNPRPESATAAPALRLRYARAHARAVRARRSGSALPSSSRFFNGDRIDRFDLHLSFSCSSVKPCAAAAAIDLRQRFHDAAGGLARKPVVDGLRIAPRRHDAGGAELGEMLRQRRLRQPDGVDQRADRAFALDQLRTGSRADVRWRARSRRRAASAGLCVSSRASLNCNGKMSSVSSAPLRRS